MMRTLSHGLLSVLLLGLAVGCGATAVPTTVPATQTPWIVVVTATPGVQETAPAAATQTPWIVVVTATPGSQATPDSRATPSASPVPLVSPTSSATSPEATEEPAPTRALPVPTQAGTPLALKYAAPELMEPPDGIPISYRSTVVLEWKSVGDLATDEYYHVHLDAFRHSNAEFLYGDYLFTKETKLTLEPSFLLPFHPQSKVGPAVVYWWVRVVKKTGEDAGGKPLGIDRGQHSEKRTFIAVPRD